MRVQAGGTARSLTANDLIGGEWLDARGCGLFLATDDRVVGLRTFPAPGWAKASGEPLWRIAEVQAWASTNIQIVPRDASTCLYRHFDEAGNLLYVGISLCAAQRTKAHRRAASWFRQVRNITVEWHPNRRAAEEAERLAIRTESPAHNEAGVPKKHTESEKSRKRGKEESARRRLERGGRGRN